MAASVTSRVSRAEDLHAWSLQQRRHIRDLLLDSPSLHPQVPGLMLEAYADAAKDAVDETGLPIDPLSRRLPLSR